VDLGSVDEDALGLAPESFTVSGNDTTFAGRRYPGAGVLDTERSPTGIFNAATDDLGILGDRPTVRAPDGSDVRVETCRRTLSNLVEVYPWGDLGARCSVGNGVLDSEDLDVDLLLNARGPNEDLFRYVVDLNDPRFRVRTGVQTVDPADSTRIAGWTLYRVPLREVDRTIGQPNIRQVKHLRLTFLTPPDNGEPDPVIRFAMARMRLLGAPWIARAEAPIAGLAGSTAQPTGEVTVTSISTENIELGYQSPPGLGSTLNDRNAGNEGLGIQVNEKSLRTIVRGLRPGERAEAYHRFVSGAQNLLAYRVLRVWARGRGEGWDDQRLRASSRWAPTTTTSTISRRRPPPSPGSRRCWWRSTAGASCAPRSRRGSFAGKGPAARRPAAATRRRTWPVPAATWCTCGIRASSRPTWPRCRRWPPGSAT
jgi:hypothetical protein